MSKGGPPPTITTVTTTHGGPSQSGYVQPPPSYEQSSATSTFGNPPPPQQVIVTQLPPLVLGPQPSTVTCPSCHEQVTTKMEVENSSRTHLMALTICLICFPFTCIPYCMDSCKSKNHYCPRCGAYLGRYEN